MRNAVVWGKPHIYASEDHAFPRSDWANIPGGKVQPASACSTIRRARKMYLKLEQKVSTRKYRLENLWNKQMLGLQKFVDKIVVRSCFR